MKFIHISDLHLGKKLCEYSMLDDQQHILKQILKIIADEMPDGVFISGDIYDKSVPSAEAVALFDDFLVQLSALKLPVFIISGNHDSPERLAFGGRLIDLSGIHISPVYRGCISPFSIEKDGEKADIYMLPFVKPANVRSVLGNEEIETYTDAVRAALGEIKTDSSHINILLTHQFVIGAKRSDSEEITVGGTDNVDADVFDGFDYVALGHIHSAQNVGSTRIRYCGTPLKYSFSEVSQNKSATIVEISKGELPQIRTAALTPLHNMQEIRGKYEEITEKSFYEKTTLIDDYLHITLTDEEDIPGVVQKLQTIYRRLMKLDYDNTRTRHHAEIQAVSEEKMKKPDELFAEFYKLRNGSEMSNEQMNFIQELIKKIKEEEECDL